MSSRSLSALFKKKSKSRSPAPPQETQSSEDVESPSPPSPEPGPTNESMETLVNAPRPPGQPTRGRTAQRQPAPRDHEREFGTLAGTYGFGDGLLGPPPLNPPGFKSKKAEKAAKAARKAASREASASPSASPSPSASSNRSPLRSLLSTGRSSSRLSPNYIAGSAGQSQRSLSASSSSAQGYMSTDTLLPPLSPGQDAQLPSTSEARVGEGTSRSTAEEPETRGER